MASVSVVRALSPTLSSSSPRMSSYVSSTLCPVQMAIIPLQEFGIDIVGEDNKTIIHHKVAARVLCVLSEQDMQLAARAEAQQHPPSYNGLTGQARPGGFSFASGQPGVNGVPGAQRRSTIPQGLDDMGGMGPGVRALGKSGLSFDHILSRLQGELQKSRETGADLHTLSGAMNDIHDTLGGNLVSITTSPDAPFSHYRIPNSSRLMSLLFLRLSLQLFPLNLISLPNPNNPLPRLLPKILLPRWRSFRHNSTKLRGPLRVTLKRFVRWRGCWPSMRQSSMKLALCEI